MRGGSGVVSRSALLKGGDGTRWGGKLVFANRLDTCGGRELPALSGLRIDPNAILALPGICWGCGDRFWRRVLVDMDWSGASWC
jgi:hypothetical protein